MPVKIILIIAAVIMCVIAAVSATAVGFSAPAWVLPVGCACGFVGLLLLVTGH